MRKDPEITKTEERFTSQQSNQDDERISNFNRTISKVSGHRKISSKKSQIFFRGKHKKSVKEELQMIQEIKELEKDREILEKQNSELLEKIDEVNRESIKWKTIMSKKIVELEDQIKSTKQLNVREKNELKDGYAKDLLRITKLSKNREQALINSIKKELQTEYDSELTQIKTSYNRELSKSTQKIRDLSQKITLLTLNASALQDENHKLLQSYLDSPTSTKNTFTICFADPNITLARLHHYLKLSLQTSASTFTILAHTSSPPLMKFHLVFSTQGLLERLITQVKSGH